MSRVTSGGKATRGDLLYGGPGIPSPRNFSHHRVGGKRTHHYTSGGRAEKANSGGKKHPWPTKGGGKGQRGPRLRPGPPGRDGCWPRGAQEKKEGREDRETDKQVRHRSPHPDRPPREGAAGRAPRADSQEPDRTAPPGRQTQSDKRAKQPRRGRGGRVHREGPRAGSPRRGVTGHIRRAVVAPASEAEAA